MIPRLKDYERIVGKKVIRHLRESSKHLRGKHVVHVNATSQGGGVAEILNTLVFLMNDLGIRTGWRVLFGSHSFFKITKTFHNALQGKKATLSDNRKEIYMEWSERNGILNHIKDHDIIVIHDPQPLGMVKEIDHSTTWIWRCHIDISNSNPTIMNYLLPMIKKFDGVVVSHKKFKIKELRNKRPQFLIPPSIDPLIPKNKKLSKKRAHKYLKEHKINPDIPIITQISRFDPWKDHFGVIRMYEKIKQQHPHCQLVLMGDMAGDDPEGPIIYNKVVQKAASLKDVTIITEKNDTLVNALQSESAFVFQNSIREGFALTVSEALWKETPVIGRPVGGIPLQIINGKTGYLIKSEKEGVRRAVQLLKNDKLRHRIGKAGKAHVKKNFLITRHLQDYIDMFSRFHPPPQLKGCY